MKAEHVNPFIVAVCKIIKDMCMLDLQIGKPVMKSNGYESENSLIRLGLFGDLAGEVVLNLDHATALGIVSKMVMMPVDTIDELGQSAISELCNMIAGNAATVFANSNTIIDITPPMYCLGSEHDGGGRQFLSVPFSSEVGDLSIDVFIEE